MLDLASAENGGGGWSADAGRVALLHGVIVQTLGPGTLPLGAVVLADEQVAPGAGVHVQAVGVLHLRLGGVLHDEVVCIGDGCSVEGLADITRLLNGEALRDAVRRAHLRQRCEVLDTEDILGAERVVGQAWIRYLEVRVLRP